MVIVSDLIKLLVALLVVQVVAPKLLLQVCCFLDRNILNSLCSGGIAGTHDPNYQTLAGMGGDCFGADKAASGGAAAPAGAGPKAPAAGGIAATNDPN